MLLNLNQTKAVGLFMKLDLKAREYNMLCEKLEEYKNEGLEENDEKYYDLLRLFEKNHNEIVEINKQLAELQESEEKVDEEKFNYDNLFKKENKVVREDNVNEVSEVKTNVVSKEQKKNDNIALVEVQEGFIKKIINKIKSFFGLKM